jgi:hypothetical protein
VIVHGRSRKILSVTVQGLGWASVKNGDLLERARSTIDVFVTMDRRWEFGEDLSLRQFKMVGYRAAGGLTIPDRATRGRIAASGLLMLDTSWPAKCRIRS